MATSLTNPPAPAHTGSYVLIERQRGPHLAIRYPDAQTAELAMEGSLFIDSLCQEDCLECWVDDKIDPALRTDPRGVEEITPPTDDEIAPS